MCQNSLFFWTIFFAQTAKKDEFDAMKALKILLDKDKISRDVVLMAGEICRREHNIILGSMLVLTKMGVYIKVWLFSWCKVFKNLWYLL